MKIITKIYSFTILIVVSFTANAGQVTDTYTSGDTLTATKMENIKTAVNDNNNRISTLESTIATLQSTISTLQSQIATINSTQVLALEPYLTVDTSGDTRGPKVIFSGINLQLINGNGSTETINGLGNFIIGYDLARNSGSDVCSFGLYDNQTDCENNGFTWATSHKSGSHNIVGGDYNSYSNVGGLVMGRYNVINHSYSTISGGLYNTANGGNSSISGGQFNTSSGLYSSISGGYSNTASGRESSISGGDRNNASGEQSSVTGGAQNTASGSDSSVSGGVANTASGIASSISGGSGQTVTVTGGYAPP